MGQRKSHAHNQDPAHDLHQELQLNMRWDQRTPIVIMLMRNMSIIFVDDEFIKTNLFF